MTAKFMTAAAVALGMSAMACSPAVSMQMKHPMQSNGKVADNEISFPNANIERGYELSPGTLTHTASLKSLSKKEVCFDVTLRSLAERKDLATPKGWRVFLRGEPEFEDKSVDIRDVQELQEEVVAGTMPKSDEATERVCNDRGDCINKKITVSYREAADFTVYTGEATVCFANKGHIKKSTEQITLHFDDPNPNAGGQLDMFASLKNRVAFRWKFN